MCPLAKLPGWPTPTSDAQARVAAIRRAVLHGRALSSRDVVDRLRSALRDLTEDEVERALLGAPGVVLTAGDRWQRA